jgi:hypothetical protein
VTGIDVARFFAWTAALAAACSQPPAEPPATATVSVPADPPPAEEPEQPAASAEPEARGDAGTEGTTLLDDGSENRPTGITGSLEPQLVVKQLRAAVPALRACYTAELAKTPDFEANLLLELTIRGTKVVSVGFLRSSASPQFDVCVDQALRTLSFPVAPKGGDTVARLPLRFKAT